MSLEERLSSHLKQASGELTGPPAQLGAVVAAGSQGAVARWLFSGWMWVAGLAVAGGLLLISGAWFGEGGLQPPPPAGPPSEADDAIFAVLSDVPAGLRPIIMPSFGGIPEDAAIDVYASDDAQLSVWSVATAPDVWPGDPIDLNGTEAHLSHPPDDGRILIVPSGDGSVWYSSYGLTDDELTALAIEQLATGLVNPPPEMRLVVDDVRLTSQIFSMVGHGVAVAYVGDGGDPEIWVSDYPGDWSDVEAANIYNSLPYQNPTGSEQIEVETQEFTTESGDLVKVFSYPLGEGDAPQIVRADTITDDGRHRSVVLNVTDGYDIEELAEMLRTLRPATASEIERFRADGEEWIEG